MFCRWEFVFICFFVFCLFVWFLSLFFLTIFFYFCCFFLLLLFIFFIIIFFFCLTLNILQLLTDLGVNGPMCNTEVQRYPIFYEGGIFSAQAQIGGYEPKIPMREKRCKLLLKI